jgi:hypothetical protein
LNVRRFLELPSARHQSRWTVVILRRKDRKE